MAIPMYGYSVAASYLVPATAGILRYRSFEKPRRLLAVLCVLAVVQVGSELLLGLLRHGSNYFLSTYYWLAELLLLGGVYAMALHSRRKKHALYAISLSFTIYWLIDVLFFDDPGQINIRIAVVSRVLLVAMSLLTLHERMGTPSIPPRQQGMFWLTIGVVIYSSGTVLLMGASNELLKLGLGYFVAAWHINWALTIIANLFLFQALRCRAA